VIESEGAYLELDRLGVLLVCSGVLDRVWRVLVLEGIANGEFFPKEAPVLAPPHTASTTIHLVSRADEKVLLRQNQEGLQTLCILFTIENHM
jgi:hypothetical protein